MSLIVTAMSGDGSNRRFSSKKDTKKKPKPKKKRSPEIKKRKIGEELGSFKGQSKPTPPSADSTRLYYESLLMENPTSEIALKYCIENGLLPKKKLGSAFDLLKIPEKNRQFRPVKKLSNLKQKEALMKTNKWWTEDSLPEGIVWKTLEYNGFLFPEEYIPHGKPLLYEGSSVKLTPEQEEVATFYAKAMGSAAQLKDPKIKPTFDKNFFRDFKKILGRSHVIKDFKKIDFSRIKKYLDKEKIKRDAINKKMTKEAKEKKKKKEDAKKLKYSFVKVDGKVQKIGSTIEPPGLFMGRGFHKNVGSVKARITPEDVTINIGRGAEIPEVPKGHKWGSVIHDNSVEWIAKFPDTVNNKTKYIRLARTGHGKIAEGDFDKFQKARKLQYYINKIRDDYEKQLTAKDARSRQIATAMWVLDRLGIRVGGEKGSEEADTVGLTTLRKEHVSINNEDKSVTLDFLGKDSMRHFEKYDLITQYGSVGKKVFDNFKSFLVKKRGSDQVFDKLTPSILNDHLKSLMPDLTAKNFRTYNASSTLQKELHFSTTPNDTLEEKVSKYNDANRSVAILCNHRKTVTKAAESSLEKNKTKLKYMKKQLKELKTMKNLVLNGSLVMLKSSTDDKDIKALETHKFSRQPSTDQVQKRIKIWTDRIKKFEITSKDKEANKEVATGTSKINYNDPRVSVEWAKFNEVPIEKIFPATVRDKFPWAMETTSQFKW